jgi:endonuclease III
MLVYNLLSKMSKPKKIVGPFSTKQQERLRAQWEEVYLRLKEFRQEYTATVDVEGCGCLAQKGIDAATERYQNLVSLMLSSQTKDTANAGTIYHSMHEKTASPRTHYKINSDYIRGTACRTNPSGQFLQY